MERYINAEVTHITYGKGTIIQFEMGKITVHFQKHGNKMFQYPEAFEEFLEFTDTDMAAAVAEDLNRNRQKLDEKRQEEITLREERRKTEAAEKEQLAADKRKKPKGTTKSNALNSKE